jgi:predicted aminopeptidase
MLQRAGKAGKSPFRLRMLLLSLLFLINAGCAAPSYYSQAIKGHLDLMKQRKDVAAILEEGTDDPELARELALSMEIREFAVSELHLPDNGSYTRFVQTGRDAVTWNVVAAPEFSLTPKRWCFLVSGCVPYRGYFRREEAERFAGRLAHDGYDTAVTPAIAYSTLGWFEDPLLDTMFRYSDAQLAAFIFHELAHQALYVRGDTAFSESYASFVEETGVQLWLTSTGRAGQLDEWLKARRAGQDYDDLLTETQVELEALYASGQPEPSMRRKKSNIFEALRQRYLEWVKTRWDGVPYRGPMEPGSMNNADLVLASRYRAGICAFEEIYLEAGRNMVRFQELAAARAALGKEQRHAWLMRPCRVIASGDDL